MRFLTTAVILAVACAAPVHAQEYYKPPETTAEYWRYMSHEIELGQYKIAAGQLSEQIGKVRSLIETDMTTLEKDMEAAGAPWTAGRLPVMSPPK